MNKYVLLGLSAFAAMLTACNHNSTKTENITKTIGPIRAVAQAQNVKDYKERLVKFCDNDQQSFARCDTLRELSGVYGQTIYDIGFCIQAGQHGSKIEILGTSFASATDLGGDHSYTVPRPYYSDELQFDSPTSFTVLQSAKPSSWLNVFGVKVGTKITYRDQILEVSSDTAGLKMSCTVINPKALDDAKRRNSQTDMIVQ
jgi:hypothetical protein